MIILPARRSRVKAKLIAHERSECRQAIFWGLIKCQAQTKPPYKNLYFVSGVIKRIFHTIKISLFTIYIINNLFRGLIKYLDHNHTNKNTIMSSNSKFQKNFSPPLKANLRLHPSSRKPWNKPFNNYDAW